MRSSDTEQKTLLRKFTLIQKQGLASILASKSITSSEADVEMLRHTRVFYFNKCAVLSLPLNKYAHLITLKGDRK